MSYRIYAYLRASTDEQNASRAKPELIQFAEEKNESISGWFIENESGAKLHRPKLFELLNITLPGDIILIESIDRISRLNMEDWERLRSIIYSKSVRIVAVDMPTTHSFFESGDEFTQRIQNGLNLMMIEFMAAMARKDYEKLRKRQSQGIENRKARNNGIYRRSPDTSKRDNEIIELTEQGMKVELIQRAVGCSKSTVMRVRRKLKRTSNLFET